MRILALLLFCCVAGCLLEDPMTAEGVIVDEDTDEPEGVTMAAVAEADQGQGRLDDAPLNADSPSTALAWDGVNPKTSSCWNDRRFVESTHLRLSGNGQEMPPIIYLYYSPSCRTTWARLTGGAVAQPTHSAGGRAEITRNSDGRRYTCQVTTTSGECTTAMVNDAGVTSYAFGSEDVGTWAAWARTANY